jgi:hypothetical protein
VFPFLIWKPGGRSAGERRKYKSEKNSEEIRMARTTTNTSLCPQHVTNPPDSQKNFLVVDNKTEASAIEAAFDSFTERKDIGIVLINQHVCTCPER